MIYKIEHSLTYEFSAPVFLEPHRVYLKPRTDNSQRLLDFELSVDPKPNFIAHNTDACGNPETRLWFQGLSRFLSVSAVSQVETLRANPFDFIVDPGSMSLPVRYDPAVSGPLQPYHRKRRFPPDILAFASGFAKDAGGDTVSFLMKLTQTLSRTFRKVRRDEGEAWPAAKTLSMRTGSCRDLSVLFMACCAAQGIASRFVSGYYDGEESPLFRKELHSWVEVYLEGGGWRGYDPMNGIAVFDRHTAIMSAPSAAQTAPVQGKFRGDNIVSQLRFNVSVIPDRSASPLFHHQQ